MSWVCGVCSSNNLDESTTCEICGEARPAAATAPKSTSVCTLTQTRAREKCSYADVTVPDEYNVIGENAFKGRTDLYTIRIHSGVNKIMKGAFDGCTNLYGVYVDGTLSSIGARAFAGCKYLSPEKRPTAATVAKDAFDGCSPTPIGTPSRSVGAKPAAKKSSTSSSYGKSTGTRSSSSTGFSTAGFSTEFSKASSTAKSTATTAKGTTSSTTRTTTTPPPRPSYTPPPPPPPKKTTVTPSAKSLSGTFEARFESLPLCMFIAFAAFVVLFLFTDWGLLATREAWQTAGGLAVIMCVGMLTHALLAKEDYGAIGWALSFVSVFAVAVWLFNGVDTTLAVILSGGLCILSLIYCCIAFSDVENEYGWWTFALAILNFVNLIAVMIRFSYFVNGALWQVLIAEISFIIFSIFVHNLADAYDYSSVIALTILGLVFLGIMLWGFGGYASHFVSVASLGLILTNTVCAVKAIDDYESGFGTGFIIVGVLQLVMFVITHLVFA